MNANTITPGPVFGRRDPDSRGYFGRYGGRFAPETLMAPLDELRDAYFALRQDDAFRAELVRLLVTFAGRPTPLYEARRLAADAGGARIFLKREDLTHTGAHKINNALGQALLAARMGKSRVVAETGAGQHGVASATACALMGLQCEVYMGADDMERQALNVVRMRLLGATVTRVSAGSRTLKDAINEAMRDWVTNSGTTYYLLGSVLGPHPYPLMVREFQSVIGAEARAQFADAVGGAPDAVVASVGGGSNAMGIFDAFIDEADVRLIGVEAGGIGTALGRARRPFRGRVGGDLPGHAHGGPAARRRQYRGHALDFGRARLRGRGTRARVAAGSRPRRVRQRVRRRRAGRLQRARPPRRHPAGARIGARGGLGPPACRSARTGAQHPRQPLRARRQGRADGHEPAGRRGAVTPCRALLRRSNGYARSTGSDWSPT